MCSLGGVGRKLNEEEGLIVGVDWLVLCYLVTTDKRHLVEGIGWCVIHDN